jgi:serine/threonine protein kinase
MKLIRYGQEIGCLEGRYRLQAILGSGGMADVCRAYDERGKRFVALKLVKADEIEADSLNRFITEAYAAKKLYDAASADAQNQNILRVYDIRVHMLTINDQLKIPLHYLVMEYARGGDLHHRMEKGYPYPLVPPCRNNPPAMVY